MSIRRIGALLCILTAACSDTPAKEATNAAVTAPALSKSSSSAPILKIGQHGSGAVTHISPQEREQVSRHDTGRPDRGTVVLTQGGLPFLLLVDGPLPDGATALVALNASGPVQRYIALPSAEASDEQLDRATALLIAYGQQFPNDASPIRILLRRDGTFVRESGEHGNEVGTQFFEGHYSGKNQRLKQYLRSAKKVAPIDIPGLGSTHVMALGPAQ